MVQVASESGPKPTPAALHPALRRLNVDVQGRVDEYLLKVDLELSRRGADAVQRRTAGLTVRNRIFERLAKRLPATPNPQLHAPDADAVLTELGPAEKQAAEVMPQKPGAARYTGPQKLSKLTVVGLIWALFFPMMVALSKVPINVAEDQAPPQWLTIAQIILIPLGWSAVIAPTVLGMLAIDQIRKSNGRLYGLSLALFIAALYPLLALDWAVFWVCGQIAQSLLDQNAIGASLGKLITQVLPTVACVLGDYFVVARAWLAVTENE